jgi:hypothetical protein
MYFKLSSFLQSHPITFISLWESKNVLWVCILLQNQNKHDFLFQIPFEKSKGVSIVLAFTFVLFANVHKYKKILLILFIFSSCVKLLFLGLNMIDRIICQNMLLFFFFHQVMMTKFVVLRLTKKHKKFFNVYFD